MAGRKTEKMLSFCRMGLHYGCCISWLDSLPCGKPAAVFCLREKYVRGAWGNFADICLPGSENAGPYFAWSVVLWCGSAAG